MHTAHIVHAMDGSLESVVYVVVASILPQQPEPVHIAHPPACRPGEKKGTILRICTHMLAQHNPVRAAGARRRKLPETVRALYTPCPGMVTPKPEKYSEGRNQQKAAALRPLFRGVSGQGLLGGCMCPRCPADGRIQLISPALERARSITCWVDGFVTAWGDQTARCTILRSSMHA